MPNFKKWPEKFHVPNWLLLILVLVFLLRIPSFFEPYAYGDEMIYLTLGQGIRQGIPLYSGLHDNKPPLIYLLAAVAGNLFWFKVLLACWSLATIVLFWKLGNCLFRNNQKLVKVSTGIFAILTTIPLLEGNIINAELFLIGPVILGFYLLLAKKLTSKNLFTAGLLFSAATLFKIPAAFDVAAILVFWILLGGTNKVKLVKSLKDFAFVILGFLAPIFLTFLWYGFRGALPQYLTAAFLQNFGYLSSWRGVNEVPFFIRNIPLFIRAGLVLAAIGILYWQRKALPRQFIFIVSWLAFGLFAVTLSERPYPHYLIQVVPAIAFLLALFFTNKKALQSLTLIPLAATFFVPVYYKYWYYSTTDYYSRFTKLALRQIDKTAYLAAFSQYVPRNYRLADFILKATKPGDKIFVWGDNSAVIYALARRLPPIKYVTNYHIRDFSSQSEIIAGLSKTPPTLIVSLPEAENFPRLDSLLNEKYILLTTIENAKIWKILTPSVRAAMISGL